MKNALYVQQYDKGTSWSEVTPNSKKIKPVALAIVELCKFEGISQFNLKACLGLVLPNQYCPIVIVT